MSKKVTLQYNNKEYNFDLLEGSENENAIDVSSLRTEANLITLDPGFKNTGSCKSSITFLDGEKGILRYRGYSIEELAKNANFLEVAFLLIFGELPTKKELEKLVADIQDNAIIDEDLKKLLKVGGSLFVVVGSKNHMHATIVSRSSKIDWQTKSLFETRLEFMKGHEPVEQFSF